LTWNRGAEKIYGVAGTEVIGKEMLQFVAAEERGRISEIIAGILRDQTPQSFRLRSRRSDDTLFESWINLFPIFDKAGTVAAIGAIARDITDLVKLERKQAMLTTIVNVTDDAILSLDKQLRISSWNPAAEKQFGYRAN